MSSIHFVFGILLAIAAFYLFLSIYIFVRLFTGHFWNYRERRQDNASSKG